MEELIVLARQVRHIGVQTFQHATIENGSPYAVFEALMREPLNHTITWKRNKRLISPCRHGNGTADIGIIPNMRLQGASYDTVNICLKNVSKANGDYANSKPFSIYVFYSDKAMMRLKLHETSINFVIGNRDLEREFAKVKFRNDQTGRPQDLTLWQA